jgi:hypothetical protein
MQVRQRWQVACQLQMVHAAADFTVDAAVELTEQHNHHHHLAAAGW